MEISRLNVLLSEARECYEKWKDREFIFDPENLKGTAAHGMWQVIKKFQGEK